MIEKNTCVQQSVYCSTKGKDLNAEAKDAAEKFSALFVQKILEQNGVDRSQNGFMQNHTNELSNRLLAEKMTSSPNNNIVTSIQKEIMKRYE